MAGTATTSVGARAAGRPGAQPTPGNIAGGVSTIEEQAPPRGPDFMDSSSAAEFITPM